MKGIENAWIDPNGKFFEVGYMAHTEFAIKWVEDKYGMGYELPFNKYHHEVLHELGWLKVQAHYQQCQPRVTGNCVDLTVVKMHDSMDPVSNKAQKLAIKEWCRVNGNNYEDIFDAR